MAQQDLARILQRVDELQRRNTRLTIACMALCAAVVGAVSLGMRTQPQASDSSGKAAQTAVDLHDFTLVDSQRRPRLRLTAQDDSFGGPAVQLLSEDGTVRASMQLEGEKPTLRLTDSKGEPRVELQTEADDAWLKLFDDRGARRVYAFTMDNRSGLELLSPELGKLLFESNLGGLGPMMTAWDQDGRRRVWIGGTMVGPSMMLYNAEGGVMWSSQQK